MPAKGTTFTLYLPAAPREQIVKSRGREVDATPPEAYRGSGTILVAEDDETVRTFLKQILEERGYTVITAEDGRKAVDAFKANRDSINLVILDVVMPKKNGREAYEEIRSMVPRAQTSSSSAVIPRTP